MGISGGVLDPDRVKILLERSSDNEHNAAVNGAVTPQLFVYEIPEGRQFRITEIAIDIGSTSKPGPNLFGNLPALTTGLEIYSAAKSDLTTPLGSLFSTNNTTPKTNAELIVEATDYTVTLGQGGVGSDAEQTWRFKSLEAQDIWKGGPVPSGRSIVMRVSDDLSPLLNLYTRLSGILSAPRST